jgi:hypothetical protein
MYNTDSRIIQGELKMTLIKILTVQVEEVGNMQKQMVM